MKRRLKVDDVSEDGDPLRGSQGSRVPGDIIVIYIHAHVLTWVDGNRLNAPCDPFAIM